MVIDAEGKWQKVFGTGMHTFHFADVVVVLVFLDLDDSLGLVVDFRADVSTGIFIAFVLVEDGVKMNLVFVSPLHEFGDYARGFARRINVINQVADSVNHHEPETLNLTDCIIYDSQTLLGVELA